MFRKTYEVVGSPTVTINSLGKTYNSGEVFSLHSKEITKEIEELVTMGLLKELKKTPIGLAVSKLFQKKPDPIKEFQRVAQDNRNDLAKMLKDMENSLLNKIDSKIGSLQTVNPFVGIVADKTTKQDKNKVVPISDYQEEELNTGVIYISPDKKDLTASKEADTSVSEDNLDDAVNKLKGKRGPKNGKTT